MRVLSKGGQPKVGKKRFVRLVSAVAAAVAFLSHAPLTESNFINIGQPKSSMAQPTFKQKTGVTAAREAMTALEQAINGQQTLTTFLTHYKQYRNDRDFQKEFIKQYEQRMNTKSSSFYKVVTAFLKYTKGPLPLKNFVIALDQVYGDMRTGKFADPSTFASTKLPQDNAQQTKDFADFVKVCRATPFGRQMLAKRTRLTKTAVQTKIEARPTRTISSPMGKRIDEDIRAGFVSLQGAAREIAFLRQQAKSFDAQARKARTNGQTKEAQEMAKEAQELRRMADHYENRLKALNVKLKAVKAMHGKSRREITAALTKVENEIDRLVENMQKTAAVWNNAAAFAVNFEYVIRTGSSRPSSGGTAGTLTTFGSALGKGITDGFNYYNALKGTKEKAYFEAVLRRRLSKNKRMYQMVTRYMKRSGKSFMAALSDLNVEAQNMHSTMSKLLGLSTYSPGDVATKIRKVAQKHIGRVGDDYILRQVVDIDAVYREFKPKGATDRWHALEMLAQQSMKTDSMLAGALGVYSGQVAKQDLLQMRYQSATTRKTTVTALSAKLAAVRAQLQGVDMVGRYFLMKGLQRLEQESLGNRKAQKALIDFAVTLARKDPYLIPAMVEQVSAPLAKVARSYEDYIKMISAVHAFFKSKTVSGTTTLAPRERMSMLAIFAAIAKQVPGIQPGVDHYYLEDKVRMNLGDIENPDHYLVKPLWMEQMNPLDVPEFLRRMGTTSLTPPFYVSPDTRGVNYGFNLTPGALAHHRSLQIQLYAPGAMSFKAGIPKTFKIIDVPAGKVLRELSKVFATYDEGLVYPTGPLVQAAGAGGFYYSDVEEATAVEANAFGGARTLHGGLGGSATYRDFGSSEFDQQAYMSRFGRMRKLDQNLYYRESGSIWAGTVDSAAQAVRKQPGNQGMDVLVFADGYTDESETGTKGREGRILGRAYLVRTDGTRIALGGSYDDYNVLRNYLYGQLKMDNLHLSAKTAGRTTVQDGTTERKSQNWIYGKHSGRTRGFDGALVAFTVPKRVSQRLQEFANASMFGTIRDGTGSEAYLNWAQAMSKTFKAGNRKHALIGIVRGAHGESVSTTTTDTSGKTTSTEAYPEFRKNTGELIYKLMGDETKGQAKVEVSVGGGATEVLPQKGESKLLGQGGVRVLIETGKPTSRWGVGGSVGYIESSLQEKYRRLGTTSSNMASAMKTLLLGTHLWNEKQAAQAGWFLGAQYMHSKLYRDTVSGTGAEQKVTGLQELDGNPHYATALGILWARKWNVLAGGGRLPGYAVLNMDQYINESFRNMSMMSGNARASYMSSLNSQLKSLLESSYGVGALGIRYDGKVEVVGSAKIRDDFEDVYGSMQSVWFFKKDTPTDGYAQFLADFARNSYYSTSNTTTSTSSSTDYPSYLATRAGVMLPLGRYLDMRTLGKTEFTEPARAAVHLRRGVNPEEMVLYLQGHTQLTFTRGKQTHRIKLEKEEYGKGMTGAEVLAQVKGRSGAPIKAVMLEALPKPLRQKRITTALAEDATASTKRQAKYYFRVVQPLEEDGEHKLEIGTAKDVESWVSDGMDRSNIYTLTLGTRVFGKRYDEILGIEMSDTQVDNTTVRVSTRLTKGTSRRKYYALVSRDGNKYEILLGGEKDLEVWRRKGHKIGVDIRAVTIKPKGKNLQFRIDGEEKSVWFPGVKLFGGPIFKFTPTHTKDSSGNRLSTDIDTEVTGYEVGGLVEIFRSKRRSIIAGLRKIKVDDSDRWEVTVSKRWQGKGTFTETDEMAAYIFYHHEKHTVKVVIGDTSEQKSIESEMTQQGFTGGFEWRKIRFKDSTSMGIVVDAGWITVPGQWRTKAAFTDGDPSWYLRGGAYYGKEYGYGLERVGWRAGFVGGKYYPYLQDTTLTSPDIITDMLQRGYYARTYGPQLQSAWYVMAYFTMYWGHGSTPRIGTSTSTPTRSSTLSR